MLRLLFGIVIIMFLTSGTSSCQGDIASKEEILDIAGRAYGDQVEFVDSEKVQEDPEKVEYTFNIKDRDIEFKIIAYINDISWGGEPGRALFPRPEIRSTYYVSICNYYSEERHNKLKELGLEYFKIREGEEMEDELLIDNVDELDKAAEYICYLNQLYQFDVNEEAAEVFIEIKPQISVHYEDKEYDFYITTINLLLDKSNLNYEEVCDILKKAYIEEINIEKAYMASDVS